jgi:hypothetical protein
MKLSDNSPVKPNPPTPVVADFERRFRHTQSLDTTLHLAAICAEAHERLNEADQQKLIQRLNSGGCYFSHHLFSTFVRIGRDKRLRSEKVYPFLPSSINHLAAVTSLSDKQLEKAIVQGVLNPNIWMSVLSLWMKAEGINRPRPARKKRVEPMMGVGQMTFQPQLKPC